MKVRGLAPGLFLSLFACYLSLSPGTIQRIGYIEEEMESGLQMMAVFNDWFKGRPVPDMVWSRHGPIPLLFDLPLLKLGKLYLTPDLALSFSAPLFTAALMTLVFLWLRKICSPAVSVFLTLGGAFGTMLWPYAYIGLETKQSFFILLAGYLGLARGKIRGWPRVAGFALICGLALTMKATGVVMVPAIAWLLVVQFRPSSDDWRERRGQLLASCLIIVALSAGNAVLRNFYWLPIGGGENQLRDWMIDSKTQIFTNLVGLLGSPAKGLFIFAPILIAALWAIPRAFRVNRDVVVFATLVLASTMAFLSILVAPYDDTWGPRFMHVTIAPLLLCVAAAWPSLQWKVYAPLAVLVALGVVVSFLGSFFYYGTRRLVSEDARQHTMEWLTGDNVWNEVAFNARLFEVWRQGGTGPALWTPSHIWVWTPPPDDRAWPTLDLRLRAQPQSHMFHHWSRRRNARDEALLRFYVFCLLGGVGMLWRTMRASLAVQKSEGVFARSRLVRVLSQTALVAIATAWIAAPLILAPNTLALPMLVIDKTEIIAGRDSYTIAVEGMAGQTLLVRYSIDGAPPAEMATKLDANGAVRFDVAADVPKGIYRFLAFKGQQDQSWIESDIVFTVR
jgi:hypothetical protein